MAKVLLVGGVGTVGYSFPANGNIYFPFLTIWHDGSGTTQLSQSASQTTFRTGGTLANLFLYVVTNTFDASSVLTIQVNGSNGNNTITIPAAGTGNYEDTTHTDTISAGDEVNIECDRTGASSGSVVVSVLSGLFTACLLYTSPSPRD